MKSARILSSYEYMNYLPVVQVLVRPPMGSIFGVQQLHQRSPIRELRTQPAPGARGHKGAGGARRRDRQSCSSSPYASVAISSIEFSKSTAPGPLSLSDLFIPLSGGLADNTVTHGEQVV
jgi:hypothetical protein